MRSQWAYMGVFSALAILFGYVESLIPISIGVPGVKLGIANIITIVILYRMGVKEAALVLVVRILVAGFLFSNGYSMLYSLGGALLSLMVMYGLKKSDKFSVFGVSVGGGVSHNIGQMAMARILMETKSLWYYMPVLLISGMLTGLFVGYVAKEMLIRLARLELTK